MYPLRDKDVFLAVKEMTIRSFEVGVGKVSMGEYMSKLAVEDLAFLVVTSVYREIFVLWGGGSGSGGVWISTNSCLF
jgi:hypothetical protein